MKYSLCVLLLFCLSLGAEEKISFDRQIRPILSDKCYFCHGPDAEDIKGGLQLHTFEKATEERKITKKGKTRIKPAVIIPGNAEESLLWERISTDDEDDIMPPPERHMKMTKKELALIKKWIEQGAEYESLWSFQPLAKKISVPAGEALNELDRFVYKRLKEEGFKPAQEANEDILLRRLYLSLTGLIPTPEQIAEFKADKSGRAYENTVDKLLQTKQFAEHLAVDWLDAARYADSYGYQIDRARNVSAWRDWLVRNFSKNLPYDQFIRHQLAGDMIPEANDETRLATTFNRLHMQKNEGGSTPEEFRVEYVADRAQTAATAFLGMTMECCRCHDHKYDPLSQEDYFKTFALFNNISESGLYSYFTQAVPSPTMPIINDKEKAALDLKAKARTAAKMHLASIKKSESQAFEAWQKEWSGKVELSKYEGKYAQAAKDGNERGHLLNGDRSLDVKVKMPMERHLDFSFSLWVNAAEEFERSNILSRGKGWYDAGSRGYELMVEKGRLTFALVHFYPGDEIRVRSIIKLPIKSWQHITVSYDGSSKAAGISLYLNGEPLKLEIISDKLTKEIHYGKGNIGIKIGARFRDFGFKNSRIDDFRKFPRRLSKIEVRENFQAGAKAQSKEELFEYYLARISKPYKEAVEKLEKVRHDYNEYYNKRTHIMVMEEMPVRRKTYVLKRGLYSEPDLDRLVEPGPPQKIFPFGPEYSRDRLGFAEWLVHPEHPLTARVTVNRYWQMIFGNGLVTTTNDFGSQGAYPTHPQMLDYLARYFIDSGWDLRALFKKIVMSKTFRQDSSMSEALYERDPENKLLGRGPSYYMTAEMLRDNALNAGGKMRQRSVYMNWKRNKPNPEMLIFGASRRQVCSVKREKTSSPLQPLVLMNSPLMVQSSSALAAKIINAKGDDASKLKLLYQTLTSTEISEQELAVLSQLLTEQRKYFAESKDIAKSFTAIGKVNVKVPAEEFASWTVLANTVLNLDSFYMLR